MAGILALLAAGHVMLVWSYQAPLAVVGFTAWVLPGLPYYFSSLIAG